MAYELDIDLAAREQIRALPAAALAALAQAFEVLALVPERGQPLNPANPDGAVRQFVFDDGKGLITYLLLTDQDRVDVLVVTWVSFEAPGPDRG
ncbi:hypothetical protein L6E12_31405 [Actinokineospora sp. PR83]|uniref:hypothetical protein n=1 Tax=Actinokineospora sp. PR83 TaxID=2884908 RepID=UPI0027E0D974|nr:hypothetical protein [Actinokineospora sp. PR83]MCG8920286.1 hypothetical protein [Actinokineospora sp. PR83]